jgi:predicted Zn-dependent protease
MAATQAGQAQMQLDFTRANELEADRVGMQTLAETDFDPRAMPAFFERLRQATRYYGRPPEFLSSHPVTENRIADTRGRAEQYPYKQRADSLAYQLVRAKLAVVTAQSPHAAVEKFAQAVQTGRYQSKQAAVYGYALALAAAGDNEEARRQLRVLYDQDPDNIAYRSALAKVELAAGRTDPSLRLYADGLDLYPDNKQLVQGYAQALLAAQRPGEARRLLRDYKRNQAFDPSLYRLLALSEGRAGDPIEGLLAMAEYHHQMGDTALAIQQLEQARKRRPTDFYQASRIEAELKELKNELAEREGKR